MDLGPHGIYIAAAYAFAAIIVTALVIGSWLDTRAQKRALAMLQGEGRQER